MIIDHPLLGPRDAAEFTYLGDASLIHRPDWQADDADTMQQGPNDVRDAVMAYPMIPALKATVAEFSGDDAWRTVRPPLVNLAHEDSAALAATLREQGFEMPGLS